MPRVIVTEGATKGLERCRRFLAAKAPDASRRAGQIIQQQFLLLETAPDIGRPFHETPELRELVMAFGNPGYVRRVAPLVRHRSATGSWRRANSPTSIIVSGYLPDTRPRVGAIARQPACLFPPDPPDLCGFSRILGASRLARRVLYLSCPSGGDVSPPQLGV